MSVKLALGLDFGTESVRALIINIDTGEEWGEGVSSYAHGVMDRTLPSGISLGAEFALQDGHDYLNSMTSAVQKSLLEMKKKDPAVRAENIIGIGLDFTASTPLPIKDGMPLSALRPNDPHAYAKLWK